MDAGFSFSEGVKTNSFAGKETVERPLSTRESSRVRPFSIVSKPIEPSEAQSLLRARAHLSRGSWRHPSDQSAGGDPVARRSHRITLDYDLEL